MKYNTSTSHAILITILVFFFWGFTASGNALLIPVLKLKFNLKQYEAQYVELAFYAAYFVGSLLYFIFSKKWPEKITRWGTKNIMITGLLLSSAGTVALSITSSMDSYLNVLISLFVIAMGFSLQQIIANYLMLKLGNEQKGTHRLILAGAVNSLGNTLAPLIIGHFVFKGLPVITVSLENIKPLLYLIAILYLVFAFFFQHISLDENTPVQKQVNVERQRIFIFPQLWLGMIAIFFYVGCEVSLQSNLPALVASNEVMGLDTMDAIHYFSLFGGSLLIGRSTGAIYNFNISRKLRYLLIFVVPYLAFGIVLFANYVNGTDLNLIIGYAPWILTISLVVFLAGEDPQKTLLIAAGFSAILVMGSLLTTGKISMYCVICVANMSALMWPCIYSLALKNTGMYAQEGSSLLVMMIIGGAILPPLQGILADNPPIGIKNSFALPLVGYLIICTYAIVMTKLNNRKLDSV